MTQPRALTRALTALGVGLLIAGTLQTAPASADESGAALSLSVAPARVEVGQYPGPGDSPDHPADLGRMPGSVELVVMVANTGSEPVHDIAVANRVISNGVTSAPACAHVISIPPDEPQPEPVDDVVLEPGQSVRCSIVVSGVMDEVLHEDVTTASAHVVNTDITVSAADDHFYARAYDESARVGDRVWLDSDRDGVQDSGEPGIGGVRLTVATPDGDPVPDFVVPGEVVGPQTTASDGSYLFRHLTPLPGGVPYTVTIDPASPPLNDLVPTVANVGDPRQDSSTGSASSYDGMSLSDTDLTLDFGFVTPQVPPVTPPAPVKLSVALTADASPEPAVTGSTITVKGSVKRDGKAFKASTSLEFRADGSDAYAKIKTVKSSSKGALSASVVAERSGTFRYRFAGNSTTEAGTSAGDHVDVRKATVRLTVDAPSSVTKGKSIKVKGSIKREGKKYKSTTVLEFRRNADDGWSKVKSVKSSSKGALSTSVKPSASGSYRYRFAGNSTTEAGASGADRVTVKPKPEPKPSPKEYKNCTALTKVYPHGVGRSGAEDEGGDVTNFTRDTKTYNLNKKSDRDKDGIACER